MHMASQPGQFIGTRVVASGVSVQVIFFLLLSLSSGYFLQFSDFQSASCIPKNMSVCLLKKCTIFKIKKFCLEIVNIIEKVKKLILMNIFKSMSYCQNFGGEHTRCMRVGKCIMNPGTYEPTLKNTFLNAKKIWKKLHGYVSMFYVRA